MRKTGKLKTPPVKPVQKIEVPTKITKGKVILIAALLAVGITLLVWGAVKYLTVPKGWQTIAVPDNLENTCIYEFSLQYLLGETEQKTNDEKSAVTDLYVQAAADAYRIFGEEKQEGVYNIYYLNRHPGQTVEIHPELYRAFQTLENSGSRYLYLAPIYANNRVLLSAETDVEAQEHDPVTNPEVAAIYEQLLFYLGKPEYVSLELMENNRVRLNVAEEYKAYASELGFDTYISLNWMRNAFVADYIADTLTAKGYTNGVLASYDGYIRNLDLSGRSYDFNIFDGTVDRNYRVATMQYSNVGAMIWLRNYPISTNERLDYHYWEDGVRVSHARLDPNDGLSKAACGDMIVYSKALGCAELLLQSADIYVADTLDWQAVAALPQNGAEYAIVYNSALYASDKTAGFTNLKYGDPKFQLPGGQE